MDLSLWMPTKNALRGEWMKILDVTPILVNKYVPGPSQVTAVQILSAQVISMTWTPPADFTLQPTPNIDTSLLIAGNRAGSLIFMRFDAKNSATDVLSTVQVSRQWITHVAFSSWVLVEPGICEATVAYATSSGKIGLVNVRQTLKQNESDATTPRNPFALGFHVEATFEHVKSLTIAKDAPGITALKWIHPLDRGVRAIYFIFVRVESHRQQPILVYTTPGMIRLWSASSASSAFSPNHWSGSRQFLLKTQKIHATSASVHPVTGMQYISPRDSLLFCLFDGSYHVLSSLSTSPELRSEGDFSSVKLTENARAVFERVEFMTLRKQEKEKDGEGGKEREKDKEIGFKDVNRTCAMGLHDESGVITWLHEASRPTDFSYKHDAKHNSMFVVARLWDDLTDEAFLRHISGRILACRAAVKAIDTAVPDVLFPEWNGTVTPDIRADLRGSLSRHLSGFDILLSMRMRLSLADYAWKLTPDPKKRSEYGHIAQTLLTTISHCNLRAILKHLKAVSAAFTLEEVPFVLRMVVQSVLQGSPEDLAKEGEHLSAIVHAMFPVEQQASTWDHLEEHCPACDVSIPLTNIITAECPNKHIWCKSASLLSLSRMFNDLDSAMLDHDVHLVHA
ncbi:hypothetical protein VNI00_002933 [Paramarasmius palmivorus]|uniref:Transcription factor IIIC putative zinc-finger domain-containing protein n=1 Tax=Paramarasmius palmivorus TaxID=297713 RepID=A0AAW0DZA8_9AGAR